MNALSLFVVVIAAALSAMLTRHVWRERDMDRQSALGMMVLAVAIPLVAILIAHRSSLGASATSYVTAALAVLAAGLIYVIADRFDNISRDQKTEHTQLGLNVYAAGCMAGALLAFFLALRGIDLNVGWSLAAATTAIFAVVDKIPSLRALVPAVGIALLARVVIGTGAGGWLGAAVIGTGAPMLAMLVAGLVLKREKSDWASQVCFGLAAMFAAMTVWTLVAGR